MTTKYPNCTFDFYSDSNFHMNTIRMADIYPTPRNISTKKGKRKMAKTAKFKVVVKDGDTKWVTNKKTGAYESKVVDSSVEYNTFAEALEEFLMYVTDSYNDYKITLVYVPAKK